MVSSVLPSIILNEFDNSASLRMPRLASDNLSFINSSLKEEGKSTFLVIEFPKQNVTIRDLITDEHSSNWDDPEQTRKSLQNTANIVKTLREKVHVNESIAVEFDNRFLHAVRFVAQTPWTSGYLVLTLGKTSLVEITLENYDHLAEDLHKMEKCYISAEKRLA